MKANTAHNRTIILEKIPERIEFAIQLIEFYFARLQQNTQPRNPRSHIKNNKKINHEHDKLFIKLFLTIDKADYNRIKEWDHPPLWQKAIAPIPGLAGRFLYKILSTRHLFVISRDQFVLNQDILYKYLAHDWTLSDGVYLLGRFSFGSGKLNLYYYNEKERDALLQFLYHMWRQGIVTNYMLARP